MNKIIANISIGLLLSCSMISFSMDNPEEIEEIYIPEAKLLKYSSFNESYSPVNTKDKMPKVSIDETKRVIARHGTLRLQNNQLDIICKRAPAIPIKGPISLNTLRSFKSTPYGDLRAIDNKGRQYIIENKDIDWNSLGPVAKTVTIIPISDTIENNSRLHTNVTLEFNKGYARLLYSKNNEENNKDVKKRFDKDSLPLTQETLRALKTYEQDKKPFYFQITNNESGKSTVFAVKTIQGDGEVLEYNDPYIPTKSLISSLKQLLTHRFTHILGMGIAALLFIAHYSDYFSNNINITQTMSKLFSSIKK